MQRSLAGEVELGVSRIRAIAEAWISLISRLEAVSGTPKYGIPMGNGHKKKGLLLARALWGLVSYNSGAYLQLAVVIRAHINGGRM